MTELALGSAVAAGLASFFAPCAFPLLPGYLGYYATRTEEDETLARATLRGLAGSAGIFATFLALAGLVAIVGRSVVGRVMVLEPLVGVALIGLGAMLLLDRGPAVSVPLPGRRDSTWGFAVFGVGYAIAATSCFAPLFFAVVLGGATLSLEVAVLSVAAFGIGLAAPLAVVTVLAGIGFDVGARFLPGTAKQASRVGGSVVLVAGAWQLWQALA